MTVSIWHAEGKQPVRDVDVLIVGAGLVGCSAAYFAAQAGREVVITGKTRCGVGCEWA